MMQKDLIFSRGDFQNSQGVVEVGVPGHSTCLHGAMCFASEYVL